MNMQINNYHQYDSNDLKSVIIINFMIVICIHLFISATFYRGILIINLIVVYHPNVKYERRMD